MAAMVAPRATTVLWARRRELAETMETRRCNPEYLPALRLPDTLRVTGSLSVALDGADLVILGVPSHGVRAILTQVKPLISSEAALVSLAKGLEENTLLRVTQVSEAVLSGHPVAVLTGPNLVDEIVAGQPTASVVAARDAGLADTLQDLFTAGNFRVYTNDDVVGCEVGGALKNVFALAVGMADGLGFGDNTRAALITRSLAELARLGTVLGGQPATFAGLAGLGDLVATCTSLLSRNRTMGERVARGHDPEAIQATTRTVAEGVRTSLAVARLAHQTGVEMPIVEQVVAVFHHGRPVEAVVPALMGRASRHEWDGANTNLSEPRSMSDHP